MRALLRDHPRILAVFRAAGHQSSRQTTGETCDRAVSRPLLPRVELLHDFIEIKRLPQTLLISADSSTRFAYPSRVTFNIAFPICSVVVTNFGKRRSKGSNGFVIA